MRLRLKRALFDGEKLHEPPVADVSDLLQPPRDAEVWNGDKFVPVPLTALKEVDMAELVSLRGEVPVEEEDEDDLDFSPTPKRRVKRR